MPQCRMAFPYITIEESCKKELRHSESDACHIFLPQRTCAGSCSSNLNVSQWNTLCQTLVWQCATCPLSKTTRTAGSGIILPQANATPCHHSDAQVCRTVTGKFSHILHSLQTFIHVISFHFFTSRSHWEDAHLNLQTPPTLPSQSLHAMSAGITTGL
jgi:hypothetical protein